MAKRVRRSGRPALSGISIASLQAEIQRRQSAAAGLLRKRDRIARQIAAVEAKLQAAGMAVETAPTRRAARGGGGRRPRNEMTLVEALAKVLNGKTMGVSEVADAVQAAGYKTSSPAFKTIVNITLIKYGRFKKVSRGQYTLKK